VLIFVRGHGPPFLRNFHHLLLDKKIDRLRCAFVRQSNQLRGSAFRQWLAADA
jgi:hypothetical protein